MRAFSFRIITAIYLLALFTGCANIVPPSGGKKDTVPPKLVELSPKDSLLNTRVTRIDMRFDEFITISDVGKEVKISPVMPFPLNTIVNGKKLTVKIPDSLLKENTTYRINFGSAIKDLNEGIVFKDFNYIFSTGSYFDSLKIYGTVNDAETGKPASDVFVILYEADGSSDSVVVKEKPIYVTKTTTSGGFLLPGLPSRAYRIYALKDDDDNLIYGGENEKIAFIDSVVLPVDSLKSKHSIALRLFKEIMPVDTIGEDDTLKKTPKTRLGKRREQNDSKTLSYSVAVDTADIEKRVHDVNKPIKITFSNPIDTYDLQKVFLSYDSLGTEVESTYTLVRDTVPEALLLNTDWKENTVYTIRLLKDYATDTSKLTAMPSKFIFRTKGSDDYGIINIHVASKYYGKKYLLKVTTEKDTIYKKPITDTSVTIRRLLPGKYTMAIIVDENENGKWDTGDLFAKKQPELVIPYADVIELKAGWENVLDFKEPLTEETEKPKMKGKGKPGTTPNKGDKPGNK